MKSFIFIGRVWVLCLGLALPAAAAPPGILVYGDSLSAAYGIRRDAGWATLLEARLAREKLDYRVVNASISGETTAGGLSRLPKVLAQAKPAVVVIALGSNDGLRGLPVTEMRGNLSAMVELAQRAGARVVLVGSRMPPNWGPEYTKAFDGAFAELARRHKTALVPFLLEGVADRPALFQSDQLHPTEAAQPILLDTVWKSLRPLLK